MARMTYAVMMSNSSTVDFPFEETFVFDISLNK